MFLYRREVKIIILLVLLFVIASYFSQKYSEILNEDVFLKGQSGILIYILIVCVGVLFAAVSTLPLLPVAVSLWGPDMAAIYTIIGWSVGSVLAFSIARQYGQKLVRKFIDKSDIEEYRKELPRKNLFWLLVMARIVLPVDIISYAVGLFTKMHWLGFLIATILGTTVFSFIFAYGSKLPLLIQVLISIGLLLVVIFKFKTIKEYIRSFIKYYKSF